MGNGTLGRFHVDPDGRSESESKAAATASRHRAGRGRRARAPPGHPASRPRPAAPPGHDHRCPTTRMWTCARTRCASLRKSCARGCARAAQQGTNWGAAFLWPDLCQTDAFCFQALRNTRMRQRGTVNPSVETFLLVPRMLLFRARVAGTSAISSPDPRMLCWQQHVLRQTNMAVRKMPISASGSCGRAHRQLPASEARCVVIGAR